MEVLQKKLTYEEFRKMEFPHEDPFEWELIDGKLVYKISPSLLHRQIARNISEALDSYALKTKAGTRLNPYAVVLDAHNACDPCILFLKEESKNGIMVREGVLFGVPALVIEILSAESGIYLKGIKKEVYERNKVCEYWLIEPRNKSIEIYALKNDRYKLVTYLEETGIVKSSVLEGFELEISQVFD